VVFVGGGQTENKQHVLSVHKITNVFNSNATKVIGLDQLHASTSSRPVSVVHAHAVRFGLLRNNEAKFTRVRG